MTLNLQLPQTPPELRPRIVVFGVGGAGCNAVNNMLNSDIEGVECVVANTDAQSLAQSECDKQVQLGLNITQGLGAGSRPEIGRASAEEEIDQIVQHLTGSHMVFITAGMGGGTGTGAAPVIARAARENGILTVGVVTKPFHFEGSQRMRLAEAGLQELQDVVDTLIVIPNQNLFRVANEQTTFADAFRMADEVLHSGVRGITDLMVMPGLINLDFADIRTVMSEMGKAMMGAGEADGEGRAIKASESAIANPLLDDVSMKGARGLLINISGGPDLTLYEVDEAANRVRDEVDPAASIIFGSTFDPGLQGKIRVSVFATGIDTPMTAGQRPTEVKVLKAASQEIEHDPLLDQVADYAADHAEAAPNSQTAVTHEMGASSGNADDETWVHAGADATADPESQSEMFIDPAAAQTNPGMTEPTPQTGYQEVSAEAAGDQGVESAPINRPTGLTQKVQGAVPGQTGASYDAASHDAGNLETIAAPAPVAPSAPRSELRSELRPEARVEAPPAEEASPTADAAAKKDSMFSFLRNRRKESAGGAGGKSARPGDDETESSGRAGGTPESTVRVITSADRSRREAAEKAARNAPRNAQAQTAAPAPASASRQGASPSSSAEDDLLEIPAFLRRQAN